MVLLSYVFYLGGVFYLMFEIFTLQKISKYMEFIRLLREGDIKHDDNKIYNLFVGMIITSFWLWSFVGLMTSQWLLFFTFILISAINKPKIKLVYVLDKIMNIFFLLLIILNKFHFKIDFVKLIF